MMNEKQHLVPLAEHFHSIQGEGHWVGTPMHFIRVAGCPVGNAASKAFLYNGEIDLKRSLPIMSNGSPASKCRTYDGRFFDCDTDFFAHEKISVEDLIAETTERHICLTGGEPLAHQNSDWFDKFIHAAQQKMIRVHIETSGTIDPFNTGGSWLTMAPKFGCTVEILKQADEIKYLVDENFDLAKLPHIDDSWCHMFLCPINHEHSVNLENVQRCMELLKTHPTWRLSAQWHKFIGVR
jgi:7-carboxy-7-deazaguanine synthase